MEKLKTQLNVNCQHLSTVLKSLWKLPWKLLIPVPRTRCMVAAPAGAKHHSALSAIAQEGQQTPPKRLKHLQLAGGLDKGPCMVNRSQFQEDHEERGLWITIAAS